MPQNEPFWNPYRFVPTRPLVNRERPITDERFKGEALSGTIVCSLVNLTPLFIGANAVGASRPFLTSKRDNKPFIPGSSLKGLFRSLAELVGGGCSVIPNKQHTPDLLKPCADNARLCIACRLFGMMGRGSNAKVLKGKVSIGDAALVKGDGHTKSMDVYLGQPKTTHGAFYLSPDTNSVDGKIRKYYFHQPLRQEKLTAPTGKAADSKWQIQALPHDHKFRFEVQFHNLTEPELALLLYVIALEEEVSVTIPQEKGGNLNLTGPMRHKVGYAKSLGGGSCRISIEALTLLPQPVERFSSLSGAEDKVFAGDELRSEVSQRVQIFRSDSCATMEMLRKMMVWDVINDQRDFRFPDYSWFKSGGNGQTPLKTI